MARVNNNGWDFVKVGNQYQYKEGSFIAMVTVIKDESNDEFYNFELRVNKSTDRGMSNDFIIVWSKSFDGYFSGMPQFFEKEEYLIKEWDYERSISET